MTLDDELLTFIRGAIRSLWTLEVMLLMHGNPGRTWQPADLVRETRSSIPSVKAGLAALVNAGLVVAGEDGNFVYRPTSAGPAQIADRLVRQYAVTPLAVTKAILSAPDERIQTLSDAFIIKRTS